MQVDAYKRAHLRLTPAFRRGQRSLIILCHELTILVKVFFDTCIVPSFHLICCELQVPIVCLRDASISVLSSPRCLKRYWLGMTAFVVNILFENLCILAQLLSATFESSNGRYLIIHDVHLEYKLYHTSLSCRSHLFDLKL
jgi:hypothetical protein